MVATLSAGLIFFAVSFLLLAVGVVFKKKTPLKGSCHAPLNKRGLNHVGCSCQNAGVKKNLFLKPVTLKPGSQVKINEINFIDKFDSKGSFR